MPSRRVRLETRRARALDAENHGGFAESALASILNRPARQPEGIAVTKSKADDWTIERWKTEPKLVGLELSELDQAPPLWKDLTVASAVAVLLWGAALVVFR